MKTMKTIKCKSCGKTITSEYRNVLKVHEHVCRIKYDILDLHMRKLIRDVKEAEDGQQKEEGS